MRQTASDILRLWDSAHDCANAVERSLTLLACGDTDLPIDKVAALPIGQVNVRLMRLRDRLFGPNLSAFAECPVCGERLEMQLSSDDLAERHLPTEANGSIQFEAGNYTINCRPLTSTDLLATANYGFDMIDDTHDTLVARCIRAQQIASDGTTTDIDPNDLPDEIIASAERYMTEADPMAEMLLDLTCPACSHAWQTPLEIVDFFWSELAIAARRVMRDIHQLASAYGWREADILALSPARRQFYISMASESI